MASNFEISNQIYANLNMAYLPKISKKSSNSVCINSYRNIMAQAVYSNIKVL